MVTEVKTQQGLFLVGELFAVTDGKPWDRRDGTTVEPVNVSIAVGASLIRVEFEVRSDAETVLGGAVKGDVVTLPVWANGPWDRDTNRRAPVSYRGRLA